MEGGGPTLATAGGEDVYVWHLGKPGVQLDALAPSACLPPLSGGVTALSWTSVSNSLAAASSRGTISIFSQGGAPLETMTSKDASGDGERIKCISFASHSLSLCSGGSSTELRIWDCKRKEVVRTYRGHSAAISACAYGDKDMLLASGSSSGDVLVHTTTSQSPASEPQRIKTGGAGGYASAVRALKFSPFRRSHVAAAGEEAVVELFDTARSDAPSLVKFTQHTGTVTGLAFSPVNELLLCSAGLDCRALFYDVQAKKLVKSVTCEAPICSLDFMSDGFTVAAGTQNGKVLIYDLRALGSGGAPAKSFDAHSHTHVSCVTFQHAPAKSAKGKPKVGGKENAKPTTVAAAAANVNEAPTPSAPLVANAPASARERTPPGGSAAAREMSPDSAMTTEELRRVNLKKVEEEKMKERFTSSTHEESARQSLGGRAPARVPSDGEGAPPRSVTSASPAAPLLTPSRTSRESLLEEIRQERAIEEERLRSAQSSRAGGLSTSSRGGLPLSQSGTRASRDATVGVAGVANTVLGSSFSPLQPHPSQAGSSSSTAPFQRTQQQQQQHAGVADEADLPPPPPTSARKFPGGASSAVGHAQSSPAVGRNIFFASEEAGAGEGGRGSGVRDVAGDGVAWQALPPLSSGAGGVAMPKELVPVIHAAVEHSMAAMRDAVRDDVQNLHLDMIRQFHLQQAETRSILEAQWQQNKDLKEEVVRLREELALLKYLY